LMTSMNSNMDSARFCFTALAIIWNINISKIIETGCIVDVKWVYKFLLVKQHEIALSSPI
jgi:hypothetical protein